MVRFCGSSTTKKKNPRGLQKLLLDIECVPLSKTAVIVLTFSFFFFLYSVRIFASHERQQASTRRTIRYS